MVLNKIDLIDQDKLSTIKETYKDDDCIFISVHDEIGLEDLKNKIVSLI
jgi:50S ribosomal subunit-associated GTPase HflX